MSVQAKGDLQIDNDRTRVTRWTFAPGAETGFHRHDFDYVVVPGRDGKLLLIDESGEKRLAELKQGESYFRKKGVAHNVINANDHHFFFVEIEFKDAVDAVPSGAAE